MKLKKFGFINCALIVLMGISLNAIAEEFEFTKTPEQLASDIEGYKEELEFLNKKTPDELRSQGQFPEPEPTKRQQEITDVLNSGASDLLSDADRELANLKEIWDLIKTAEQLSPASNAKFCNSVLNKLLKTPQFSHITNPSNITFSEQMDGNSGLTNIGMRFEALSGDEKKWVIATVSANANGDFAVRDVQIINYFEEARLIEVGKKLDAANRRLGNLRQELEEVRKKDFAYAVEARKSQLSHLISEANKKIAASASLSDIKKNFQKQYEGLWKSELAIKSALKQAFVNLETWDGARRQSLGDSLITSVRLHKPKNSFTGSEMGDVSIAFAKGDSFIGGHTFDFWGALQFHSKLLKAKEWVMKAREQNLSNASKPIPEQKEYRYDIPGGIAAGFANTEKYNYYITSLLDDEPAQINPESTQAAAVSKSAYQYIKDSRIDGAVPDPLKVAAEIGKARINELVANVDVSGQSPEVLFSAGEAGAYHVSISRLLNSAGSNETIELDQAQFEKLINIVELALGKLNEEAMSIIGKSQAAAESKSKTDFLN